METILLEKRAGVASITLNRPHVRNAISLEMADELRQAVSECEEDDAVKVLVFTGMGDSFVSGGDLRQFMQARGREQAQPILDRVAGLLGAIDRCSKPTIAMINGHAIGGGCEFAVSCHFRFAAEIAAQPLAGIRAYLQLLRWKRDGMSLDERIRGEVSQCAGLWGSDEHLRAVQRFLRKN